MKTKKVFVIIVTSLFTMLFVFPYGNLRAQTKHKKYTAHKQHTMKDYCMMMNDKMMVVKNGKMMSMDEDMTMKNGTVCMTNGECAMKNGTKMTMRNGDCMDINGNICNDKMKMITKMKANKNEVADAYTCPMHHEIVGKKGEKCPKCGMDLVKM
jgi:hypothetical protein